jgi:prepilin-type N-terminal cleavage/methylation domain-containing protein
MIGTRKGFTLLELLAAVALLVILGTMLFQVFQQASNVVEVSNARQEIFQYARAALEFLERELNGAFTGSDAVIDPNTDTGIKGMRVYNTAGMGANCDKRPGSQGIFFTAGLLARDTRAVADGVPNPYYLKDVNCARIAYYLNNEITRLDKAAVYRTEMYKLTTGVPDKGNPFVRNCLLFNIQVMSRFPNEIPAPPLSAFQYMEWDSDALKTGIVIPLPSGGTTTVSRRRGLPQALALTFRLTDERHAIRFYQWKPIGGVDKWIVPGPDPTVDYWGSEDAVVQTFRHVINYGHRSD